MRVAMISFRKCFYTIMLLLCFFIFGCSNSLETKVKSNVDHSLYDEIIKNVDKEPFNEIHWLTSVESGGVIVFYDTKYKDVDGDGIDELFVLRKYTNTSELSTSNDYYSSLDSFIKFSIKQCFISKSYKIVDDKVEELIIDNEPVETLAFDGGHFGTYYFLLDDGKIVKYYGFYWEEHLMIYNNLKLEKTISHIGDMDAGEWYWAINGKKTKKSKIEKLLRGINFLK